MEIYIVRHGETVWNKEKRLQGRTNVSLSEYGIELAKKTGKALQNVKCARYDLSSQKIRAIKPQVSGAGEKAWTAFTLQA